MNTRNEATSSRIRSLLAVPAIGIAAAVPGQMFGECIAGACQDATGHYEYECPAACCDGGGQYCHLAGPYPIPSTCDGWYAECDDGIC